MRLAAKIYDLSSKWDTASRVNTLFLCMKIVKGFEGFLKYMAYNGLKFSISTFYFYTSVNSYNCSPFLLALTI